MTSSPSSRVCGASRPQTSVFVNGSHVCRAAVLAPVSPQQVAGCKPDAVDVVQLRLCHAKASAARKHAGMAALTEDLAKTSQCA